MVTLPFFICACRNLVYIISTAKMQKTQRREVLHLIILSVFAPFALLHLNINYFFDVLPVKLSSYFYRYLM